MNFYEDFNTISIPYYIYFLIILVSIYYYFVKKITWIRNIIYPFFYVSGVLCVLAKTEKNHEKHLLNNSKNYTAYTGVIVSETEEKENTYKAILRLNAIKTGNQWIEKKGKIYVYFYKKGIDKIPKYGDCILIKGIADTISKPKNPNEFNFKRFYEFLQIHHRHFVAQKDIIIYDYKPENMLVKMSFQIRSWAEKLFKTYITTERERKISSALILGIKGSLDWEIMQAYASTGTMHVLAVSGLHVGIIYQILVLLCFWTKKITHGKWIKATLLLLLLWFYALITGLSPSVLRSVSMFTFIIIAEATNRKSNIYNTLSASCLFLLCINPYMIMEVGFQLSYLAVLGIVYIQPKIYQLIALKEFIITKDDFKNNHIVNTFKRHILNGLYFIIDWVWMITCVSIAAQIATFSLGMLYFHQFPNYFLLSNLFVIPAALGIMYVGLSFVLFSYFDFWANFTGTLIQFCVEKLNMLILLIEDLPFSVVRGISISILDTWLIYVVLIVFLIFITNKNFIYFILLFILLTFISLKTCYRIIKQKQQMGYTIYAIPKGFGFDFFEGNKLITYLDSSLENDYARLQFHVLNNRWSKGCYFEHEKIKIKEKLGVGFFVRNNMSFAIINKKIKPQNTNQIVKVDYLIIQNNTVWRYDDLTKLFAFKTLVLDGTNSKWYITKFEKTIPKNIKINYKKLLADGAINCNR